MTDYQFISWNVDSINAALTGKSPRAALSMAVFEMIAEKKPDVLCIQETKLRVEGPTKAHLAELERLFPEYNIAFRSSEEPARKGYAGTMMIYKKSLPEPVITKPEIGAPDTMDSEGRILTLEFPDFYVTTVYTPNSGDGLKRLSLRQEWDDRYREYLSELDKKKPVMACGDFNAAHQEIDLANPKQNHFNAGFTDEEREKFSLLLAAGFTDSFRHVHGDVPDIYSWFSQRSRMAKVNNTGWRIDYWLVSDRIADQIQKSEMLDSGTRQDHVPILLEVSL